MAFENTFASSQALIDKAGLNVNTYVSTSQAILADWAQQAEAWVNAETRTDWVTASASLAANYLHVLSDVISSKVAINLINFDMSGYTSRAEAQTMLDVNRDIVTRGIAFLKDVEYQETMGVK